MFKEENKETENIMSSIEKGPFRSSTVVPVASALPEIGLGKSKVDPNHLKHILEFDEDDVDDHLRDLEMRGQG